MRDENQKKIDKLLEALKKPIPKDPKLIRLRSIWLALMCIIGCKDALKIFFIEFDNNSGNNRKKTKLWFEMSILAIATALGFLEECLKREFPEKKNEEIDDICGNCEIDAICVLSEVFNDRIKEEIFDIYASYTWFDQKIIQKKSKTPIIKRIEKSIRNFAKIKEDTQNKEHHFANRIKEIFNDIDLNELVKFAKMHVSIQGLLLFMDAFAAVDQEKINKDVVEIFSILGIKEIQS